MTNGNPNKHRPVTSHARPGSRPRILVQESLQHWASAGFHPILPPPASLRLITTCQGRHILAPEVSNNHNKMRRRTRGSDQVWFLNQRLVIIIIHPRAGQTHARTALHHTACCSSGFASRSATLSLILQSAGAQSSLRLRLRLRSHTVSAGCIVSVSKPRPK